MNAICIRVLTCLFGCIGWAVLAAEPTDPPSQELLASYSFQPKQFMDPSVVPDPQSAKPFDYDIRDLDLAIATDEKRRSEALFTWDLPRNRQLQVLAKPNVQVLDIPWSPIMATEQIPFSPASAVRKLEVRVPVIRLLW